MSLDQHGFTAGRSTITAMTELRNWISKTKSRHVIGALLDISGAFDNVKWLPILEDLIRLGATFLLKS